jgi:hypothetical protein
VGLDGDVRIDPVYGGCRCVDLADTGIRGREDRLALKIGRFDAVVVD